MPRSKAPDGATARRTMVVTVQRAVVKTHGREERQVDHHGVKPA